jgi:hypothetical protein
MSVFTRVLYTARAGALRYRIDRAHMFIQVY